MTEQDIPAGLELCRGAGWNQVEADWRLFLNLAPETTILALLDGNVAGSAALLDYGSGFAWVSMVLVDPAYRGRGVGTALFERTLEMARNIPCVQLDASPEGRQIYKKYGFVDEFEITRFSGVAGGVAENREPHARFQQVCEWDRDVFGADRREVLRRSFECLSDASAKGFALAREGSLALHVGPVAAASLEDARSMLEGVLSQSRGSKVFIDIPSHATALAPEGFSPQRRLIRMSRGSNPSPGKPERQFAILGPEFG